MSEHIVEEAPTNGKPDFSNNVDECSNAVADFSKTGVEKKPLGDLSKKLLQSSGLDTQAIAHSRCFSHEGSLAFEYLDPSGNNYTYGKNGAEFFRYRVKWSDQKKQEASEKLETLPKYLSPKKCACTKPYHSPLHVAQSNYSIRLQRTKYPIILTEGEKKTLLSSVHELATGCQTITIGLGGVSAWSDKRTDRDEDGNRVLIPELLEEVAWEGRDVYIAFDSDINCKPEVKAETESLAIALHKVGANPYLIRLPQEIDGKFSNPKNGLDDFIIRHGYSAFLKLLSSAYKLNVTYENVGKEERRYFVKSLGQEPGDKSESHVKALMSWTVLKESLAVRRAVGLYEWNRTHWQEQEGKAREVLALHLDDFYDAQRWVNRVGNVFNNANAELERRLNIDSKRWAPGHLLAFTNVVLDTATNKTLQHEPQQYITQCLPYPYDKAAKCPKWLKFLGEALGGDKSLIKLSRALTRWILMPKQKDMPFDIDKAFNLHGVRGSGKGTFVSTLSSVVGLANVGAGGPEVYGDKEKLARLVDKKLALCSDAKGFLPNSTVFNMVVSNEPVIVERKYKDSESIALGVVVVWASNEAIQVAKDGAEGVGRRLITLPFNNPPKNKNPNLKEELREELAGIFQWAWSMGEDEMKRTLSGPIESDTALECAIDQLLASNQVLAFCAEKLPEGIMQVKATELFAKFQIWRKERGHDGPFTINTFGAELKKIKGATKKQSNGVRWSLPAMRRLEPLELERFQKVPNGQGERFQMEGKGSKILPFYDYAEHLGIGRQVPEALEGSERFQMEPLEKKGSTFSGERFHAKTTGMTAVSGTEDQNGTFGTFNPKSFCIEGDMGYTPANRKSLGEKGSAGSKGDVTMVPERFSPSVQTNYDWVCLVIGALEDRSLPITEDNIYENLKAWKKAPNIGKKDVTVSYTRYLQRDQESLL